MDSPKLLYLYRIYGKEGERGREEGREGDGREGKALITTTQA